MTNEIYLASVTEWKSCEKRYFGGLLRRIIIEPEWTDCTEIGVGNCWLGKPQAKWLLWFQRGGIPSPAKKDIERANAYRRKDRRFYPNAMSINLVCRACGVKETFDRGLDPELFPWPEEDCCHMCM